MLHGLVGLAGTAAVVAAGILVAGHADVRPGQLVQLSGAGACVSQLDTRRPLRRPAAA